MNFILGGGLLYFGNKLSQLNKKPEKEEQKKNFRTYNNPSSINTYDSELVRKIGNDYNTQKLRRHIRARKPSITGIIPDDYNTRKKDKYGDLKITDNAEEKVINSIIGNDLDMYEEKGRKENPFQIKSDNKYQTGGKYDPELTYEKTVEGFSNTKSKPGIRSSDLEGGKYANFSQNPERKKSDPTSLRSNNRKKSNNSDSFKPYSNEYDERLQSKYTNNSPTTHAKRTNKENTVENFTNKTSNGSSFKPNNFLDHEREFRNSEAQRKLYYDQDRYEGNWSDMFDDLKFDNPTDPVGKNAIPNNTCNRKRIDMERELSAKDSWSSYNRNRNMTYNVTPDEHFVHNNMVPMFRTKYGYGNYDKGLDTVKDQKLELFTGSSKFKKQFPKRETGPRFAPQMNIRNIYGAPNIDYGLDRYSVMLNDTKNGELAFDPVRVNPGLNLDYYEQGNDGYQPTWRGLPRTTNETRNLNKPKIENGNMINHGQRGSKRGVQASVNKNRPFTFYEQGPEDLLRTYGYVTAPKLRENYQLDPTRRDYTNVAYVSHPGTAYGDIGKTGPDYMYPKHKISDKITYGNAGLRNINKNTEGQYVGNYRVVDTQRADTTHAIQAGHMNAAGQSSYFIDPKDVPGPTTKEQTLFDTGGYSNMGVNTYQGSVPWNQQLRTTTKEQFENTMYSGNMANYSYQGKTFNPNDLARTTTQETTLFDTGLFNKVSNQISKQKAFDPKDKMKTTMKELIELEERGGNLSYSGGYTNPAPLQDKMKTTRKQLHQLKDRGGNLSGGITNQHGGYESANYVAPTTLKQLIENSVQGGNMSGSNLQNQGQVGNYHMKTTMRQILENATQGGNMSGGIQNQGQAGNYHMETTMREIMENAVQGGNVSGSTVQNSQQISNYKFGPTMRQIHENATQAGNMGANHYDKGGYIAENPYAKPTIKQTTSNVYKVGAGSGGNFGVNATQTGNYYMKPTIKQTTSNVYYNSAPSHYVSNHQVYDPFYNMEIDDRHEILAMSGRAPTTSNYTKVKSDPFTGYRLKRLDNSARLQHGMEYNPQSNVVMPCFTREQTYLQENPRFDVFLNNTLKSNPYNQTVFGIDFEQMAKYPNNQTMSYTGYYNPNEN